MFPAGASLAASGMEGVVGCSEAGFGLTSTGPGTCPSASRIGTLELDTPLLDGLGDELRGSIYVAQAGTNVSGAPIALYLEAEREGSGGGGLLVKLAGQLTQDPVPTGRLTLSLSDIPQLPLSNIELTFNGGPRALFDNPPTCGTFTTNSELAPWSEGPDAMPSSSFQITEGATGGPCSGTPSSPPPDAATTGGSGSTSTVPVAAIENSGSVSLDGSTIDVRGDGEALVKLACTGTSACGGKLSLTGKVSLAKGKRAKTKAKSGDPRDRRLFDPTGQDGERRDRAQRGGAHAPGRRSRACSGAGLTVLKSSPAPTQTVTENVRLVRGKGRGKSGKG